MAGTFAMLGVAASGMTVYRTWLDAVSDNVANISTIRSTREPAFQERLVVARSLPPANASGVGGGAAVDGVRFGSAEGRLVYDPASPLADEQGMVRAPDMDLTDQMTALIMAQRAYQANVTGFERVRDAYLRALEVGR